MVIFHSYVSLPEGTCNNLGMGQKFIQYNLESHSVQEYVLPQHMAIFGQKLWDHGHPQSTCSKHVQKYCHPHI